MAIGENTSRAAAKFSSLPVAQQIGLLVGLAASVAIGIWVVLWSREPIYRPLFSHLSPNDAAEVTDVLQRNGYPYRVNKNTGSIMVSSDYIHDARMKLAVEGLPKGDGSGYEMFSKGSSLSSSQFMENARYRHALETELARTIARFNMVKGARVHLAIPKQSAFLRDSEQPKASVFLNVYSGRRLSKQSIASISNLVASSVPGLKENDVTVVDQSGELLNEGSADEVMSASDRFYEHRREIENNYSQKIKDLIEPIIGVGKVRAKVAIDMDFTSSEQTREIYNPDLPALRSEQLSTEHKAIGQGQGGVVGAAANQVPQENEQTTETANTEEGESEVKRKSTRNFELDKTISHTVYKPGKIERLTIAVLVDNQSIYDAKTDKTTIRPLSEDEINKLKVLVADAVGYNSKRGDSLNIINIAFNQPEPVEEMPSPPIYERPWMWSALKQSAGGLFLLIFVLTVIRPTFKALAKPHDESSEGGSGSQSTNADPIKIEPTLNTPEARMDAVKNFAGSNPKGVADVVKNWVEGD